jgi:tRNA (guanine-N7-)-methyltransferase
MGTPSITSRVEITDLCARLDWGKVFGNGAPVVLDLGAGDGGFALAYAKQNGVFNLLAVERLLGRVRKIEKRAARAGLNNVRVLRLELGYTVKYLLPPESVLVAYILFPDPWPKRRHWPRRLIQPDFVRDLAKALVSGGELRFATDHADYFEAARAVVNETGVMGEGPGWPWQDDPKTDFQRTFEAEGRPTFRANWIKSSTVDRD